MLSSVTACESRRCCRGGLCHARRDVKVRPGPVGKLQQPFHNNFAEYQFQTQATGSSPLSISLPSPLEFPKSSAFYATTPSQQAPVNWLRVSHPEPSRLARPEVTRPASAVTPIRPTARPPHLLRRRQPVPTAVKTLAPGCLGRASSPPPQSVQRAVNWDRDFARQSGLLLSCPKTGQTLFFLGHIHTDASSSGEEARQRAAAGQIVARDQTPRYLSGIRLTEQAWAARASLQDGERQRRGFGGQQPPIKKTAIGSI